MPSHAKEGIMGFESLEVCKKSARLSTQLFKQFASHKDFGYRDQITKAGLSIPSNLAEGEERSTLKECCNFLNYAKGSCGELKTQTYIGIEIAYIDKELGKQWIEETNAIASMLGGMIKSKKMKFEQKA
jgi:four helix bundle protein